MAITMFIIAGAAVSLTALCVLATRTQPALASDNTVIGLRDSSVETLMGRTPQARAEWQLTTIDDLTDAEDLLDSLEAGGYADRELVVIGNNCFAVRWR